MTLFANRAALQHLFRPLDPERNIVSTSFLSLEYTGDQSDNTVIERSKWTRRFRDIPMDAQESSYLCQLGGNDRNDALWPSNVSSAQQPGPRVPVHDSPPVAIIGMNAEIGINQGKCNAH